MDVTQKNVGYTAVEIAVIIVVLSILCVLVVARWPGNRPKINSQARSLAGDIRYAQSLAMTQGVHYRLNILSTSTYSITTSAGGAVLNPSTGSNVVTLSGNILFGTLTGLPSNLIAFSGQGKPYTDSAATTTALASTAVIPLTVSGQTCNVSITQETGKVTVTCP
jgi:Tfp pilus assembly protein FimT